jgi:hypothetical protein
MNTRFSDFIRNATYEEKEKVYQRVMERASERQKQPKFSYADTMDYAKQMGLKTDFPL